MIGLAYLYAADAVATAYGWGLGLVYGPAFMAMYLQ